MQLKDLIAKIGLSDEEIAKRLSMSKVTIKGWRVGMIETCYQSSIDKVKEVFGEDISDCKSRHVRGKPKRVIKPTEEATA